MIISLKIKFLLMNYTLYNSYNEYYEYYKIAYKIETKFFFKTHSI